MSPSDADEITASEPPRDRARVTTAPSERALAPPTQVSVPAHCQQPERVVTEGFLDHGEGQGSTLLTGPVEGEFSAYEWPVPDASVIRVLAMDCDAGGVTWPGALLFYDEQAELVGTVWLEDLGEAHKGGFMLSGVPATMQPGSRWTTPSAPVGRSSPNTVP